MSTKERSAPEPSAKMTPARNSTRLATSNRPHSNSQQVTIHRFYEPDHGAQLRALRLVLDSERGPGDAAA